MPLLHRVVLRIKIMTFTIKNKTLPWLVIIVVILANLRPLTNKHGKRNEVSRFASSPMIVSPIVWELTNLWPICLHKTVAVWDKEHQKFSTGFHGLYLTRKTFPEK